MRVLVTAASRHGSTTEIAGRIAGALARHPGVEVVECPPQAVDSITDFDACVIGSAVYMGHWLDAARDLVRRHQGWRDRPVWLFSSGPIGDPPRPDEQPVDVGEIVATTYAPGALVRDRLTFTERAMVAALRAPYGDFRDWDAIDAWADGIAGELAAAR
jgi:menaquinone-dependent protoporphyrinogen oxidase